MKLEIKIREQVIHVLDEGALEGLLSLSQEAIQSGEGYPCLVDLRKAQESSSSPADACKAQGVKYVHIPVTDATLSEQDLDTMRRECARGWPRLGVLSTGGQRAAAMVLMHAGRVEGWSAEETVSRFPELRGPLRSILEAYLERHRDRVSLPPFVSP